MVELKRLVETGNFKRRTGELAERLKALAPDQVSPDETLAFEASPEFDREIFGPAEVHDTGPLTGPAQNRLELRSRLKKIGQRGALIKAIETAQRRQ